VISQIDAPALHKAIESGQKFALLDVRETWEFERAKIADSICVPMSTLASRVDEIRDLQSDKPLVVICHHGIRSMHVAQFLASQGFEALINLRGGIDAWSIQVDPSIPVY
jgi:rhodanese-related sulfurtransferase